MTAPLRRVRLQQAARPRFTRRPGPDDVWAGVIIGLLLASVFVATVVAIDWLQLHVAPVVQKWLGW